MQCVSETNQEALARLGIVRLCDSDTVLLIDACPPIKNTG